MKPETIQFLEKLKKNNNREWFAKNRALYEAASADFLSFTEELIAGIARFDPGVRHVSARDCVFRIFRDVRFSKVKTPYKPNFGAFIAPGGRKSGAAGYYFHMETGGKSMVAGGAHMPESPRLLAIRNAIADQGASFQKILEAPAFKKRFGTISAEQLKTCPKGFSKDHPFVELLKFKSFTVFEPIADTKLADKKLMQATLLPAFKVLVPFNDFLNRAMA